MPQLSVFQAVNSQSKPLIKLPKYQQEEALDRVAHAIEGALLKGAESKTPRSSKKWPYNAESPIGFSERTKLRRIIGSFDRKAIVDNMHEEHIASMAISLNKLRVDLQKEGVYGFSDASIRQALLAIKAQIEKIICISLVLQEFGKLGIWQNSLLDLRSIGMQLGTDDLDPYYSNSLRDSSRTSYEKLFRFCMSRVQNHFTNTRDLDHLILRNRDYPFHAEEARKRGIEPFEAPMVLAKERG